MLDKKFLTGLNNFFGELCHDNQYVVPTSISIDKTNSRSPQLSYMDVFIALSKVKKTAAGPDGIPYWFWSENALCLTPVVKSLWNLSLATHTWPKQWKMSNINPLPKVDARTEYGEFRGINVTQVIARCFEKVVYHKFVKNTVTCHEE